MAVSQAAHAYGTRSNHRRVRIRVDICSSGAIGNPSHRQANGRKPRVVWDTGRQVSWGRRADVASSERVANRFRQGEQEAVLVRKRYLDRPRAFGPRRWPQARLDRDLLGFRDRRLAGLRREVFHRSWYVVQAGTGAIGFSTAVQQGDNTRLIERISPPTPGPSGWRVILPGQCVFGTVKPLDDEGTIGKYLIDLPARTRVYLNSDSGGGKWVPWEERMTFEGSEAPHVPIEDASDDAFYYRTSEAGRYAVTVRRTDAPKERTMEHGRWARFSLIVTLGEGGGMRGCSPPKYESNCFGEMNDD